MNPKSSIGTPYSTYDINVPQLYANVDRERAKQMGVALGDIYDTMQVNLGSLYVNDFSKFGKTYQVVVQADAPYRADAEAITALKTRNSAGEMVPLGALMKVEPTFGPTRVTRYNGYPSADINGAAKPGFSSGQAEAEIESLLKRTLTRGISYEWTELTYQDRLTRDITLPGTAIKVPVLAAVMMIAVLLVILVLSAQYESWSLPMVIVLIVPMCVLAALFGVWLSHFPPFMQPGDLNIFTQVALVVLVGLACKNAILIVEFAKDLEEQGEALHRCRDPRLPHAPAGPILMTSIAFCAGVLPLIFGSGAGSEMRRAMGIAVFSGMLGVTIFGIFLTPVFYVLLRARSGAKARASARGACIHRLAGSGQHRCEGRAPARWTHARGDAVMTRRLLRASIALVVIAIALAACAVGPDYRAPAIALDASYLNAGATAVNAAAPDKDIATFWRGFADPALSQLVERALAANGDVRIAQARLRESRALLQGANAELLPEVDASADVSRSLTPEFQLPGTTRSQRTATVYDGAFTASWELDFFGRHRRASEAAAARVDASAAGVAAVGTSIAAEVARNYLELRGLQQRKRVADESIANQRDTLRLTETRLEFGRGTRLDVSRARSLLASTEATLPALQAAIDRGAYRLATLTAQSPRAVIDQLASGAQVLPSLPVTDLGALPVGTPEQLLRRRPDLVQAERQLAAATADIGVVTADLFPRVSLSGLIGLAGVRVGSLGDSGTQQYSLGAGLTWPVLDFGRVRSRIAASRARAEQQLAGYEQSVAVALEETEGALTQFSRNAQQSERLAVAAAQADEAARLAAVRFDAGSADFLTVLDAQRQALATRDTLVQAQVGQATALVAVYRALGGGWPVESAALARAPSGPSS